MNLSPTHSLWSKIPSYLCLNIFLSVCGAIAFPHPAAAELTKTLPYPTQIVEGQEECIIFGQNESDFTPQEKYVKQTWTPIEKLTWQKLCQGEIAGAPNDIEDPEQRDIVVEQLKEYCSSYIKIPERANQECQSIEDNTTQFPEFKLSGSFLETILLREPFRSALPRTIVIKKAIFDEALDFSSSVIDREIHLEETTFYGHVKFEKAKFSQSVYFNDSTFHKTLALNDASIQGSLFARGITFENYCYVNDLPQTPIDGKNERILINLKGIQVDNDIHLNEVNVSGISHNSECPANSLTRVPGEEYIFWPLSALAARIGNSLYLDHANLDISFLCEDFFHISCQGIDLTAVKLGDAISITRDAGFSSLSLKKSQMKTVLIRISDDENQAVSDVSDIAKRMRKWERANLNKSSANARKDSDETEGTNYNSIFFLNIGLQDAIANNFQVLGNGQKQISHQAPQVSLQELKEGCTIKFDGFQYKNVNQNGFKILNLCLKEDLLQEEKKTDPDFFAFFQPLEQAATIAREQGNYPLEKELLYRRKKLELKVASQNQWSLAQVGLWFSDVIYGFGYKRANILPWVLLLWAAGSFLAFLRITQKQKEILENALKIRNQEIDDEMILDENGNINHHRCCTESLKINEISHLIDSIERIIFLGKPVAHSDESSVQLDHEIFIVFANELKDEKWSSMGLKGEFLSQSKNKIYFPLELIEKKGKGSVVSVGDFRREIKNLLDRLEIRNPGHQKVGFCQNLLPDSQQWLIYAPLGKVSDQDSLILSLDSEKSQALGLDHLRWQCLSKSLIYSADLLLPFIELDQALHDFIFLDSKEGTRFYFIIQKLLAAAIASILLPLLFVTGL